MKNLIIMDDLGVPLFFETSRYVFFLMDSAKGVDRLEMPTCRMEPFWPIQVSLRFVSNHHHSEMGEWWKSCFPIS